MTKPAASTSASQPVHSRIDFQTELMMYLGEDAIDWKLDPIDWWRVNAHRFPILAAIARRFLSAPATSVASEQLFSVANVVFDPRRSRLSAVKAEQLIFLNRNLPLLNYEY